MCPCCGGDHNTAGQLLWREFYYLVAYATPGFDTMHANPICRQIDWDTNAEHLAVTSRHAKQSYANTRALVLMSAHS